MSLLGENPYGNMKTKKSLHFWISEQVRNKKCEKKKKFSQVCGLHITHFISAGVRYYYGLLSALQLLVSALCLIDTVGNRKICDFIPKGNKTHTKETKIN